MKKIVYLPVILGLYSGCDKPVSIVNQAATPVTRAIEKSREGVSELEKSVSAFGDAIEAAKEVGVIGEDSYKKLLDSYESMQKSVSDSGIPEKVKYGLKETAEEGSSLLRKQIEFYKEHPEIKERLESYKNKVGEWMNKE